MDFLLDNWLVILIVCGISICCVPLLAVIGLLLRVFPSSSRPTHFTPSSFSEGPFRRSSTSYSSMPVSNLDLYVPKGKVLGDLSNLRKGPDLGHLRFNPSLEHLRRDFPNLDYGTAQDFFVWSPKGNKKEEEEN